MSDILKRSISEHADALEKKEYSSVELTGAFLERIERENSELNAYITVARESALTSARESDDRRARGETRGALDGIPYTAKDNISVRGLRLSCASRMLENYVSPYDASVISALRDAGAVLLGKTNLDEFAMGTGTDRQRISLNSACRSCLIPLIGQCQHTSFWSLAAVRSQWTARRWGLSEKGFMGETAIIYLGPMNLSPLK